MIYKVASFQNQSMTSETVRQNAAPSRTENHMLLWHGTVFDESVGTRDPIAP